jgi:hypothetical protein
MRWLLVRRSLSTGELAFYRCAGPVDRPLAALVELVRVPLAGGDGLSATGSRVGST